mmetsp:Transcript_42285/g.123821  ORF Transcript_42285/g.123821 Transcript_42285/m.123821 type:complete len:169 (-) Transcript_42285:204-710(-)
MSLSTDDVIIPIKLGSSEAFRPSSQWAATNAMPTQLHVQEHAVQLAFAITDYKVQGRTLDKLVLSIGSRPFEPSLSLPSLYVLASRVRKRAHLRVLGWNVSTDASRLRALRHPPELSIWHSGYNGSMWSAPQATKSAKKACNTQAHRPTKRMGLHKGYTDQTAKKTNK